jgi:ABC-2 type transport system permease protein
MVLALPGMVAALGVAALRFDLSFTVSPLIIPAVLLVALTSVAIGYGLAYAAKPEVAGLVTQLILFMALMFAPINYPAERLPDWVAQVHAWLPFVYMAQAIRETLNTPSGGVALLPFAILAAWGMAGLAVTYRVMTRRN